MALDPGSYGVPVYPEGPLTLLKNVEFEMVTRLTSPLQ